MGTSPPTVRALRLGAVLLFVACGGALAQSADRSAAAQQPAGWAHQPVAAERAAGVQPGAPRYIGDQTDGSRARPVHAIQLRDTEGEVIRLTDRPLLPFSPRQTCGADCHDVGTIGRGWHFTVTDAGRPGGRRSEPWILVDAETATQLPLSYRADGGAFDPEQVGITPWKFAVMFGGRTPGGISGAREPGAQLQARWVVSGDLEVNCLACHDASAAYDHAEYGRQLRLENFRWAPSAASGIALVTGAANEMPNTFDYLFPFVEDSLLPRMPVVSYSPERFLPGAKLVFDVVREVTARRCYFCHSSADLAHTGQGRWSANVDQDIHLARGMTCVDCHRNGLDHAMIRGYEGEVPGAGLEFTCRGCHLASEPERNFARGRFGAPYPRHAGFPPVHFTKLSCTACHSGPRPEKATRGLKTSQAHGLGGLNVNKASQALPHLYYPVFAEQPDGKTTPNRLVWPAFWGRLSNGAVRPIPPERVKRVMAGAKVKLDAAADGSWRALDEAMVSRLLQLLQERESGTAVPGSAAGLRARARQTQDAGTVVYVAGGRLHRLDASGSLVTERHQSAQPYLWPLAHDVRPAALALGARGCSDCHDPDSPVFFGDVTVDSPLASDRRAPWTMHDFQKSRDTAYVADLARSFHYRPWLKGASAAAGSILLLFALAYLTPALRQMSASVAGERWKRIFINLIALVACAASIASGFQALLSGRKLSGYELIIHVGIAPVFAVAAVLVVLFWAQRNAFEPADWNRVRRPLGQPRHGTATSRTIVLRKAFFWAAVAAAVPAVASATLALFPLLPSVDQDALFLVHRYSVAVLGVASCLFTLSALVAWLRGDARDDTHPALTQTGG